MLPPPALGSRVVTTSTDLAQRLLDLSVEQLSVAPAQLGRDTTLRDDLGLDSLAAIEWGMAIEDAFGIALPEDAMEHVKTYGDVEALVGRLVAAS
jgi:acyl carrier protein